MEHTASRSRGTGHKSASLSDRSFWSILRESAIASGFSLIIGLLLAILCTAVCARLPDPIAFTQPMGIALSCLVFLLCGILSVRRNRGAVLRSGLCSGGLVTLLFLLARIIFDGSSSYPPVASLLLRVLNLGFSLAGAYLGRIRAQSVRKARSHGHKR